MKKTVTQYEFKFSFVMPVYNVGSYLAATIESILDQSMEFEQNVQLILVNDGSTDNSEAICRYYKDKYPHNIIYVHQSNRGVSAARNAGLERVRGKYVSFLDPDDLLSPNTLQDVYDFFESNYSEIDFVSIKLEFFEARAGEHRLNYKYDTTRVIDIDHEYNMPQLSAASAFFKADLFSSGKYEFDTEVSVSEDVKLLTEILFNKMKYGVVSGPTYYYRRRAAGGSAIDASRHSKDWYITVPSKVYGYIFDYSVERIGSIHPYIQFLVMYDIAGRFKQSHQDVLSQEELQTYKTSLYSLISKIDDHIIMEQHKFRNEYKFFLLSIKHNQSVIKNATQIGKKFYYNDLKLYNYKKKSLKIYIYSATELRNEVVLEGYFTGFLFPGVSLRLSFNDKLYEQEYINKIGVYFFDELVHTKNNFRVSLPKLNRRSLRAYADIGESHKSVELHILDSVGLKKKNDEAILFDRYAIINHQGKSLFFERTTLFYVLLNRLRRLTKVMLRFGKKNTP